MLTKFALRASEVIFDSEVYFVSEVSPDGEVNGKLNFTFAERLVLCRFRRVSLCYTCWISSETKPTKLFCIVFLTFYCLFLFQKSLLFFKVRWYNKTAKQNQIKSRDVVSSGNLYPYCCISFLNLIKTQIPTDDM